jgi:DivIVA domain-containing protein
MRVPMELGFAVVLRGYDRLAVDALVARVAEALESDDGVLRVRVRAELDNVELPVSLRGYDRAQVDAFLRRAWAQLV